MQKVTIAVNPNASLTVHTVGEIKIPPIVMDDFANAGEFCDTGLFRNRSTGLKKITVEHVESNFSPAVDINPDPRTGRLTANIFVDFFRLGAGD